MNIFLHHARRIASTWYETWADGQIGTWKESAGISIALPRTKSSHDKEERVDDSTVGDSASLDLGEQDVLVHARAS